MKKFIGAVFFIMLVISIKVYGQTKIDLEAFSYSGYEHNVFKSPKYLFDTTINDYIDQDELLVSDNFMDLGYNAKFEVTKRRKYNFEVKSDFSYRGYFNYSSLNQKVFSFATLFEKNLMRDLLAGAEYTFKWNDKLGTSVTGEELIRSFKYFSNAWEIYSEYTMFRNLEFLLKSSYEYKHYYQDNSLMPLDNSRIDIVLKTNYELTKVHSFYLGLGFVNKQYKHIPASDKLGNEIVSYDISGNLIPGYPLRELNYFNAELGYDLKIIRGLLISPGLSFWRRADLYKDYYSYTAVSPDLKIRYLDKKWYLAAKVSYKNTSYDERFAYTIIEDTDLLVYKYFKYDLKARYKLSEFFELYFNFESDERDSNSELEYRSTRRAYTNYEVSFGINAAFNLRGHNIFK